MCCASPPEELEHAIANHRPDSHGLTVLPFVAGERAPGWHDTAQAIFQGMTPATTPTEIYIAVLEAIAYRFAQIQHRLMPVLSTNSVGKPLSVVASGGALTKSPAWMQLMADVLGMDIIASNEPELTARGAAVLALLQLGLIEQLDAVKPAAEAIYRPDQRHRARYGAAIQRQAELYARNYGGG
ncbi:MAG: hypothetical protein IPK16_07775 [Anaerolineales bacterium]|nr:hypothetical protein [Anaerolineales bacterium]